MEGATEREDGQPAVREGGGVVAGGFEPERVVRGGCLRAKSGSPGRGFVARERRGAASERTVSVNSASTWSPIAMSGARAVRDGVCAPTSAREGHRAGGRRWLSRERLELEVTAISTGKMQTD